jgi:hypothetical protein
MEPAFNYFLSLPHEVTKEMLLKLSVSDILNYFQAYSDFNKLSDKFWFEYITNRWSTNSLQTGLTFDIVLPPEKEIYDLLKTRIKTIPNEILSFGENWPLAYALFLENSKLITFTKSWTKNVYTTIKNPPTKIKKDVFVSKYDKLATFLNPGIYGHGTIGSTQANFFITANLDGKGLKFGRLRRTENVPLLKISDNRIYCGDVAGYGDLQIGDITVDDKSLFDVITNFEIVETYIDPDKN